MSRFCTLLLCLCVLFTSASSPAQVRAGSDPALHLQPEIVLDGDPFDVSTGIYYREYADLFVPDSIPIVFSRTQRTLDDRSRAFGIGGSTSYDMFIIGDVNNFSWVALVMPDGSQARFTRISPGHSYVNGVFEDRSDPSEFRGAQISWGPQASWNVRLLNGTVYTVQGCGASSKPGQCAVVAIQNAKGDRLTIKRDRDGNIERILSPHGHFVDVKTDPQGRITHASTDSGQWVDYVYDEKGCLSRVQNWRRDLQVFGYDDRSNMVSISEKGTDSKGPYHFTIRNRYDAQNRFAGQLVSTGQKAAVTYQTSSTGHIVEADVNDGATLARHFFDEAGWITKEDLRLGARSLWQLDYVRGVPTHDLQDLLLTCPSGKLHIPLDAARNITQMGDERKQYLRQVCQRAAAPRPALKPAAQQ